MRRQGRPKRTLSPQARNQYSRSWGGFLCFRMIESRSSRTEPRKWSALRPKLHSIPSRSNSAWQTEQAAFPCINAIPFESEHKFMVTLHEIADRKQVLFVKGQGRVGVRGCVPMLRNVCETARGALRRSPRACRLFFRVVLGEFGFLFLQQVDSLREGQVVGHLAEVAVGFRGLDVQLLEE